MDGQAPVLFFASPIGLGHATRDSAIARLLGGVTFVSGGPAARFLEGQGFEVIDAYDPPRFDVSGGALGGRARWLLRYWRYYARCKRAAARIIAERGPGLVVSDEDFASLSVAHKLGIRTALITDILETRFASGPAAVLERRMNRSMRDIMARCDVVVMPEDGPDEGNIRRVGPVVRGMTRGRDEIRKDLGFSKKTILVCAGGTDAGRHLLKEAAAAAAKLGPEYEAVVAPGPSIQDTFGARSLGYVPDLHEAICAADLVVSLAGRSTMDEAAACGTPGIFIPIRGHFEQEDNAARAGFSHGDVHRLAELMPRMAGTREAGLGYGGAERACSAILSAAKG